MADLQDYQSSSEEQLVLSLQSSTSPWRRRAQVAGAVAGLLLLAAVVAHSATYRTEVSIEDTESFAQIPGAQPNWAITTKERDLCSSIKENCATTGCCQTTGFKCIKAGKGGKCGKYCPKGNKPCVVIGDKITFDTKVRTSLFCFSVYTKDTGSTKKSYELELLTEQCKKKVSLFACDKSAVYGDVAVSEGDLEVTKVDDVDKDFHFAKRKHMGTWINTGLYIQVWKAIAAKGDYAGYDWTVKVDADAVFFPEKLIPRISHFPIAPTGGFLANCEGVKYGFFGNLEVFSKTAFSILLSNLDTCKHKTVSNWKVGIDKGKYGPMGEDLFAEICLRKNGVEELDAFDITKDGCCAAKRPGNEKKNKKWEPDCASTSSPAMHPFKKVDAYFKCMDAAKDVK